MEHVGYKEWLKLDIAVVWTIAVSFERTPSSVKMHMLHAQGFFKKAPEKTTHIAWTLGYNDQYWLITIYLITPFQQKHNLQTNNLN